MTVLPKETRRSKSQDDVFLLGGCHVFGTTTVFSETPVSVQRVINLRTKEFIKKHPAPPCFGRGLEAGVYQREMIFRCSQ